MATRTIETLVTKDDIGEIGRISKEIIELKALGAIKFLDLGEGIKGWVLNSQYLDKFKIEYCEINGVPYRDIPDSTLREFAPDPFVLKNYCYIYFLIEDTEVVYIGQTENLFSRIDRHRHDKVFSLYGWAAIKKDNANYFEAYLLRRYFPKYNQIFPIPDRLEGFSEHDIILLGWQWK